MYKAPSIKWLNVAADCFGFCEQKGFSFDQFFQHGAKIMLGDDAAFVSVIVEEVIDPPAVDEVASGIIDGRLRGNLRPGGLHSLVGGIGDSRNGQ